MVDIFPFGVAFDWDKDGEPTSVVLFERNCPIPSAKVLTFHRCANSLYCEFYFASCDLKSWLRSLKATVQSLAPKWSRYTGAQ